MGLTYARGIESSGISTGKIMLLVKHPEQKKILDKEGVFDAYLNPKDCVPMADFILMAVKPFHAQDVFSSISPLVNKNCVLVSVMAGVKTNTIKTGTGLTLVARSMPNLPAQIGKGLTTVVFDESFTLELKEKVTQILSTTGPVVAVDTEDDIDKSTGISGSGSAYVFYFMQAMEKAALEMGFSSEQAKLMITQTFDGAVNLYRENEIDLQTWIDRVTSKGGTTQAALTSFKENTVGDKIQEGVFAAYYRAKELGKEN